MKKLLVFLLLLPTLSFGQIIINQEIVEAPPYTVGDTVTMRYVLKNVTGRSLNYFWLRFHYSNKHLQLVPNSTQFTAAATSQTYNYQWVGYRFVPNPNIGIGELDRQFTQGGVQYAPDPDWNVGQINSQSTTHFTDGVWATQKFIIKDQQQYTNIHKLDMAEARDYYSKKLTPIGSTVLQLSLNNVKGTSSMVKFRVAFPSGYSISKHNIQIMNINADNTPNFNSIVKSVPLDASGEALVTTLQSGKKYFAIVTPAWQDAFMDNIVTVSDAYKAFLQISDKGLNLDKNYFTTPLEFLVGNVTIGDNVFDTADSYALFAYVMGIDVSETSAIPSSSPGMLKFYSGQISEFNQAKLNGLIDVSTTSHTFDFAYAWGGDLDFSHSTPLDVTSIANKTNRIVVNNRQANTSLNPKLGNGKLEVEVKLSETDLAGAQYRVVFDTNKLELLEVVFDSGSTITNFSSNTTNSVTFGSIDNLGTARIKAGTPYKLVFKTKSQLANTSGLFYVEFAEAVSKDGDKINLNIQ